MSGKVVSWAMEQHTGSPAAKLVLAKLADNADEGGFCWPSIERITQHTELGQSTVYKHLATLEGLGLFHMVDIQIDGAEFQAFHLHVPGWDVAIPRNGKIKRRFPAGGKVIPPGGMTIPAGGKVIPPGGMTYIEEPSLQPSEEPSTEPSHTPVPASKPSDVETACAAYNETAKGLKKWTVAAKLTPKREKLVAARLRDDGLPGWYRALELAAASAFLGSDPPVKGEHMNWRVTLDWFAKPDVFTRILEGAYPPPDARARPTGRESIVAAREAFLNGEDEHV